MGAAGTRAGGSVMLEARPAASSVSTSSGRSKHLVAILPSGKEYEMAAQRTSFEKLQRDRAKKARRAAKLEKRLQKGTEEPSDELTELPPPGEGGELTAA